MPVCFFDVDLIEKRSESLGCHNPLYGTTDGFKEGISESGQSPKLCST